MIVGLYATLSAAELRDHCLARARYHSESVAELNRDLESRRSRKRKGKDRYMVEDETHRLVEFHSNKAAELEFLADHLETDEKYRLSRDELCLLGLIRPERDLAPSYVPEYEEDIPF